MLTDVPPKYQFKNVQRNALLPYEVLVNGLRKARHQVIFRASEGIPLESHQIVDEIFVHSQAGETPHMTMEIKFA